MYNETFNKDTMFNNLIILNVLKKNEDDILLVWILFLDMDVASEVFGKPIFRLENP